jgi:kynureninase
MDPVVTPVDSADSWQLSNPPILSMAAVLASLEMFDAVGLDALRDRSIRLTGYLETLLDQLCAGRELALLTPRDPHRRGAQLSVRIGGLRASEVSQWLRAEHGVFADARNPDVIRLAPAPMYNTFHDCWRAATALASVMDDHG